MKVLQFNNSDNSLVVRYLTDLIGSNETFTILQFHQVVNGVEQTYNTLTEAAMQDGFFHTLSIMHTIAQFLMFAQNKGYTLKSFENLVTGSTSTTIWDSGYGDGGAIGEGQL